LLLTGIGWPMPGALSDLSKSAGKIGSIASLFRAPLQTEWLATSEGCAPGQPQDLGLRFSAGTMPLASSTRRLLRIGSIDRRP
jgi:hypothetical protein